MIRAYITAFILMLSAVATTAEAQGKNGYKYELASYDGAVSGDPNYSIVKVWSYGKREKLTRRECIKNAVHGIIFKGYAASSMRAEDRGKAALCPGGYDTHEEYFDKFFSSGDYLQYVQESNNGELMATDVIKIASREYKVGMVVVVNTEALRKRLEQDGIIKRLDFLF